MGQIKRSLSKSFYWYNLGRFSKELMVDKISYLLTILNRLKKEKYKRKRYVVMHEWHSEEKKEEMYKKFVAFSQSRKRRKKNNER